MTDEALLAGRTIGITADRRWEEQAALLTRRGAAILHGPTLRTIELSEDDALRLATQQLIERPPDLLIATTGMGMRLWFQAAAGWGLGAGLHDALSRAHIFARGAKSASAVKSAGLEVAWQAPSERMTDIVDHLDREPAGARRVALQLFDPGGHPSTEDLRARASELVEVPVYRWLLPADPAPAQELIAKAAAGRLDAVTFTAQPAVHHLFRLAEASGRATDLRAALNGPVHAVCVGPVCAEAAREEGIGRPHWPQPPRLVAMIRLLTDLLSGPGQPKSGA